MIFLTGDTHRDFRRFDKDVFPEQKVLTKDDYEQLVPIGRIL